MESYQNRILSFTYTTMPWIWISPILITIFFITLRNLSKNKNSLPGPVGLPIIGHFHLLSKNPHQDLCRLARKYGPIMAMRFGSIPTIIVSSPAAAKIFLKAHDLNFADRPHHEASWHLAYEQKNIVFGPYTPYWRNMRKLCTMELLGPSKISQFQPMRKRELGLLVDSLKQGDGEVVDMSVRIMLLSADMICLMVFGKKYSDKDLAEKGFKKVMKATMEEAGAFNLRDYFPYLRGINLPGLARRLGDLSKIFDGFLERIIDEHSYNKDEKDRTQNPTLDFVDTMMSIMESGQAGFDFDRRHVKAVLLDMLLAGMDTGAAAVEWTLSELIKHPEIRKKLQKELSEVVGMNQMVEESHLPNLKYLDYVVRESLRLHPVGPLLIHQSIEDCTINGYHIPKKTRVLVNVWAIGRDPDVWKDAEMFWPERFEDNNINNNVDVRGRDFELIPFGTGRRGCPGMQLGLTMVQLVVAQLVHCFDWELPPGMVAADLDMFENFGLVTSRANHLMAIPIYRLSI
ncbi:cytochrome P450 71AU50-like [Andrographis paniculata]|uniref:cytochrome P450 71AU50-like n=1 Tax=Andrographis paniculata TaxID=175694 RepID=UPI0021E872E8|nr:cytochrome P450 71AU50-like [Andrographis paniculata]